MNTRILIQAVCVALLLGPLAASAAEGGQQAPADASTPGARHGDAPAADEPSAGAKPSKDASSNDTSSREGRDGKGSGKGDGKAGAGPGEFIPSEEISEDYAVSFPVDI